MFPDSGRADQPATHSSVHLVKEFALTFRVVYIVASHHAHAIGPAGVNQTRFHVLTSANLGQGDSEKIRNSRTYCSMFRITLSVVLMSFAVGEVYGTETSQAVWKLEPGKAAVVDVDADRLDHAVSIVRHAVEDDEIPGAVVLVARRGRVILHQAFGYRDCDRKRDMRTDSLFRMASNSKAVTATGIMLLVEDGKLDLDAPVGAYLPAFDNAAWRAVTLRHLLTHTSGVRIQSLFLRPLLQKTEEHPNAPDLLREVDRFASFPPEKKPGATYAYNNAGFNMLAAVIEQIAGSYKDHLRTRLYEPLGMGDSCNHEPDADHDRMSTVMKRQPDGTWKAEWSPGAAPDWPFPRGSGGMVSTAWDYAVFCQMLLNRGVYDGKRILSRASVEEMTSPQVERIEAAKAYGLGWVCAEPGGVFSHTGSDGTYVWVDPATEVIGMVLTQTTEATRPRNAFRRLVHLACIDRPAEKEATDSQQAREAVGFYKDIFMSGGKNLSSRKTLHAAANAGPSVSDASTAN